MSISIIAEFGSTIDLLSKSVEKVGSLRGKASMAFRKAVIEANIYLGRIEHSEPRSFDTEADLARLWSETAQGIKDYSRWSFGKKSKELTIISKNCDAIAFRWAKMKELDGIGEQISALALENKFSDYNINVGVAAAASKPPPTPLATTAAAIAKVKVNSGPTPPISVASAAAVAIGNGTLSNFYKKLFDL